MRFGTDTGDGKKITCELNGIESQHLLQFLLHAKFCDDMRLEIVGSPTMNNLLHGLVAAREALEIENFSSQSTIDDTDGSNPPSSFFMIEAQLKKMLGRADVTEELKEYLYPFVWKRREDKNRPIFPGVRVEVNNRLGDNGERALGVALHSWRDPNDGFFKCFVALDMEIDFLNGPPKKPEIVAEKTVDLTIV